MNIHEANGIDFVIIGIVSFSIMMGIVRGFVREAMSLITWIAAIAIGILYCEPVSTHFSAISLAPVRLLISFVLLVLATLITGGVINHLFAKLMKTTGFSFTDRIIGTIFGFARGLFITALMVLMIGSSPIALAPTWKNSQLVPYILPVSIWLKEKLPEDMLKHYSKTQPKSGHTEEHTLNDVPNPLPEGAVKDAEQLIHTLPEHFPER